MNLSGRKNPPRGDDVSEENLRIIYRYMTKQRSGSTTAYAGLSYNLKYSA